MYYYYFIVYFQLHSFFQRYLFFFVDHLANNVFMVVTIEQVVIRRLCFSGMVIQSVIFPVRFAATEVVSANLADRAGTHPRRGPKKNENGMSD